MYGLRHYALLVIVAMGGGVGCGGGGSPTAPSSSVPQAETLSFSPIVSGAPGPGGFGWALQDVTVFQFPVQATATLRWSDGRKDLDLYWTNSFCVIQNGDFGGTGCQILSSSISASGTLETVSGPASAGSTIRLFVINYSTAPEAATMSVRLEPN